MHPVAPATAASRAGQSHASRTSVEMTPQNQKLDVDEAMVMNPVSEQAGGQDVGDAAPSAGGSHGVEAVPESDATRRGRWRWPRGCHPPRGSGKDFLQNFSLAISCAQIFFVVIQATRSLLPELFVSLVLNLAIFSLDLSLTFPALNHEELEWVQLILQLILSASCSLFLCVSFFVCADVFRSVGILHLLWFFACLR